MSTSRSRLLIPLTMVWVVRNVVFSRVLEDLVKAGVDPVLLVPEPPPEDLAGYFSTLNVSVAPLLSAKSQSNRCDWFLNAVLNFAHTRRNSPTTFRIRRPWYQRHLVGKALLRTQIAGLASGLFTRTKPYEWLRKIWERRFASLYDLNAIVRQFQQLGCDAVWFNNWGMGKEGPYVAAAQVLQIPSITSIISFDNVLTKGVRPRFRHYLVWSERIACELRRSDSRIEEEQISVVGTPQFDFHRRTDCLWDRATTLECLGLPKDSRFFLYGAGRECHSPGEIELVRELERHLAQDPRFAGHSIVVRLHPLDPPDRWFKALKGKDVIVCEPFHPRVDEAGWSWASLGDQALLVSSLYHADACLSVASTIALDAAITGTPPIGLQLDREENIPPDVYFDAYELEHYRPLVASAGIWVVRSWTELHSMLERAVNDPLCSREERQRMVGDTCGPVDGHCGLRTAQAILEFIKNTTRKPRVPA